MANIHTLEKVLDADAAGDSDKEADQDLPVGTSERLNDDADENQIEFK